jgi:hypothetical protein
VKSTYQVQTILTVVLATTDGQQIPVFLWDYKMHITREMPKVNFAKILKSNSCAQASISNQMLAAVERTNEK